MKNLVKKIFSVLTWKSKNNNKLEAKHHRETMYHMRHGRAPVHKHPADLEN